MTKKRPLKISSITYKQYNIGYYINCNNKKKKIIIALMDNSCTLYILFRNSELSLINKTYINNFTKC